MSDSQQYLADLSNRLSTIGFTIARNLPCQPYLLELVATKREPFRGRHRTPSKAVIASTIDAPSSETLAEFISTASKYVLDNLDSLQLPSSDLDTITVVIGRAFSIETKKWISDNRPSGSSFRDRFDFPILVALDERKLYYFSHTPFRAGLLYKMLRNWSDQYLGFVEAVPTS